jgi:hypothetical protein
MSRAFLIRWAVVVAAAASAAAPVAAAPLTVTWGAQGEGGALASSAGLELPPGCLVRLGYFDRSLSQVQETAWDLAALELQFTEVARATTGTFDDAPFDAPGSFAQSFSADSAQLPALLVHRTLCLWACNGSSLAEASEIGIFTSPAWTLTRGLMGSLIWDLNQVEADGLIVGSFSPTESPTLGGQMNQLVSLATLRDAADVDRDGVPALVEEALGMDPATPDATLMPEMVVLAKGTQSALAGYRLRRPVGGTEVSPAIYEASGFRFTVEVSDTLAEWRIDPDVCRVHQRVEDGQGYEWVTLRPPLTNVNRPDFYRLKIERLPVVR